MNTLTPFSFIKSHDGSYFTICTYTLEPVNRYMKLAPRPPTPFTGCHFSSFTALVGYFTDWALTLKSPYSKADQARLEKALSWIKEHYIPTGFDFNTAKIASRTNIKRFGGTLDIIDYSMQFPLPEDKLTWINVNEKLYKSSYAAWIKKATKVTPPKETNEQKIKATLDGFTFYSPNSSIAPLKSSYDRNNFVNFINTTVGPRFSGVITDSNTIIYEQQNSAVTHNEAASAVFDGVNVYGNAVIISNKRKAPPVKKSVSTPKSGNRVRKPIKTTSTAKASAKSKGDGRKRVIDAARGAAAAATEDMEQ